MNLPIKDDQDMSQRLLENPVIQRIIDWGSQRSDLRAVILTSSLCNPSAPVDRLSDYDVILVMKDIQPYHDNDGWMEDFGHVLVLWRDPIQLDHGQERFARITQYEEDGLKIDFTFWPVELLSRIVAETQLRPELDVGYQVLLDKDGLTTGLKPPMYRAHIPNPPTEVEYLDVIEVFFHEATYMAKHLWRDDLMPAKYQLDKEMKADQLRRMLEWRMEIDYNWSVKPGVMGRGLKQRTRPDLWSELEHTYVGAGIEENWEALFATAELMRTVGREVAQLLGYSYPEELHKRAVRYLHWVKELEK
jgi:aminoglycoside 6-adenylyltransferase